MRFTTFSIVALVGGLFLFGTFAQARPASKLSVRGKRKAKPKCTLMKHGNFVATFSNPAHRVYVTGTSEVHEFRGSGSIRSHYPNTKTGDCTIKPRQLKVRIDVRKLSWTKGLRSAMLLCVTKAFGIRRARAFGKNLGRFDLRFAYNKFGTKYPLHFTTTWQGSTLVVEVRNPKYVTIFGCATM